MLLAGKDKNNCPQPEEKQCRDKLENKLSKEGEKERKHKSNRKSGKVPYKEGKLRTVVRKRNRKKEN